MINKVYLSSKASLYLKSNNDEIFEYSDEDYFYNFSNKRFFSPTSESEIIKLLEILCRKK